MDLSFDFNFTDTLFMKKDNETEEKIYDSVVVGGGPAAMSAAMYLARKGCSVLVLTEKAGGQLVETTTVENYPSIDLISGKELADKFNSVITKFNISYIEGKKVVKIEEEDGIKKVVCADEEKYSGKTVIIATGSKWKELNVPGERELKTRGVAYCTTCDAHFFKDKKVAVAGGGNSGIEAAIDLAGIAELVTVIEYADELKADTILIEKLMENKNVEIVKNIEILSIKGDKKVESIEVKERETGNVYEIESDGIFVEIGILSNSTVAEGILKMNEKKEIEVDSKCRTNADGIFAAGDVTDVPYKQIVIAAGEGAKAALSAYEYIVKNR